MSDGSSGLSQGLRAERQTTCVTSQASAPRSAALFGAHSRAIDGVATPITSSWRRKRARVRPCERAVSASAHTRSTHENLRLWRRCETENFEVQDPRSERTLRLRSRGRLDGEVCVKFTRTWRWSRRCLVGVFRKQTLQNTHSSPGRADEM